MSAHPAFELRFAVRAVSGHRAATWKVWTLGGEKNDVYVACRGLGGQLKASLHQSGQWHVSFTKQFFEAQFIDLAVDPKKRFGCYIGAPHSCAVEQSNHSDYK